MMDIVKVTVWVPNLAALKQVLSAARMEHDCGSPKRDADGNFIINPYGSPAEAAKIEALNFRYEVDSNYGAILEERQKEVSRTDRFKGGTLAPVGLGIKR
jgi:hypothetical protein